MTLKEQLILEICEDYKNGRTLQQIGDDYGYTTTGIIDILEKAGIQRRPKGRKPMNWEKIKEDVKAL